MDTRAHYIGLMSGTSMDGIDAVLVTFDTGTVTVQGHTYHPWPQDLKNTLRRLSLPGENEIDTLGVADIEVAIEFSRAVFQLLKQTGFQPEQIKAIGSHGQTIRHRPDAVHPFTLQVGDPNHLAEQTGITVVADFRRRDIAAEGQGAPLAPAFHAAFLHHPAEERVILNLGGIANITVLPGNRDKGIIGFDTGPANTLMDAWSMRCQQRPYDQDGAWAASGHIQLELLERLLNADYFKQPAPKSTGPELFNLDWLEQRCHKISSYKPEDIQATLCALSIETITRAIGQYAPRCSRLICCGGGTANTFLMEQLGQRLKDITVEDTTRHGIPPDQIEATAFAWLAYQTVEGCFGNLPSVTGASHPVILGGIYQA
ncbi:MAG: anhydro-N-acetylmuramic acid kinase [Sedimenticola selenatireducens]|uniref:Anhydro-N-acetylmuramic acid kinase n=1 Tax=Sedimenticola selenatireducens TaxID=191960 RepID=A0A558DLH9_9GAMM|nr:anhydro-N-acetylmuramic acid kinase [Sedimenticola selenatireducens]TVT61880.1 MAG: anhydro-N-acetylmuramic acid kinase [Sedimenticola selenatireducens]